MRMTTGIIEWTGEGIKYEADNRHAQLLLTALGLNCNSKSIGTPGDKDITPMEGKPLNKERATQFRANVASDIYLAQDRTDIIYAVK